MNIIQSFYDDLAPYYDQLFLDWDTTTDEQAEILDRIFKKYSFSSFSKILDCACGIGTQAIGLARLGYDVTGSDISSEALAEARRRASDRNLSLSFLQADFCRLSDTFRDGFDIVIAMDNALPHMLTSEDLRSAVESMVGQVRPGGLFVASIRDYDALLNSRPSYSPPYIHKTQMGQRVSFQTWEWEDDRYKLIQYIIEDGDNLSVQRFPCAYRATRRAELTDFLYTAGCRNVEWLRPETTGFYQPIVVGMK